MTRASQSAIVTVVHGDYHDCVSGWLANLRAVGCRVQVHLIVLDGQTPSLSDAAVRIEPVDVAEPVLGSGDFIRLKRIRDLCSQGRTCVQIDLDTCFHVDPLGFAALPAPFVISRGLGFPPAAIAAWGFSLCTGFYIAKPGSLPLLERWIALEHRHGGLDQASLNHHLLEAGVQWRHAFSPLVEDAFVVSDDGSICVLPDRAVTRDPAFTSFGVVHHRQGLERHRQVLKPLSG